MDENEENVAENTKCGYCGVIFLKSEDIWNHIHFQNYDKQKDTLLLDGNRALTIEADETSPYEIHDFDELLIKEVQRRPGLYNYRLPVAERTDLVKHDLWKEIYNCLRGAWSIDKIKRRWNTLKDMYAKEKKVERKYIKSGSAAPKKNVKKMFHLFELMTFLDDLSEPSRTISSLSSDSEVELEEECKEKEEEEENKRSDKQFYQQLHTLVTTSQPSLNKEYPPEWILMYLGPMMRQLDEFRRVRVQKRFQEILQMELSDQEKSE